MKISRFSVTQPVLANVIVLLVLGGSAFCYLNITQEVMPVVPLNIATVSTTYSGAPPDEVEQHVTVPLEDQIMNLQDIDELRSTSVQGRSQVIVEFEHGVQDMDGKMRKLKQEVDIAETELPEDAKEPIVQEEEFTIPVLNLGISDPGNLKTLKNEAEYLEGKIRKLDGVARVNLTGAEDFEIEIDLDPHRMESYRVDLGEVQQALNNANVSIPTGTLKSENGKILGHIQGQFTSIDQIQNTVIASRPDRAPIRIRDIARDVQKTFEDQQFLARINGERSILLLVKKTTDGNTIEIAEQIQALVTEYQKTKAPEEVSVTLMNDRSKYVNRRLNTINTNLIWGLALVVVVLMLFLEWRIAFLAALGIPFALGFAMILHYWFGGTANMIALFSFLVVLGVIVDDKIIIAENCFRLIENGKEPVSAAIEGTDEVFWPVVIAVASNIAAFSPLLLIEGRIGDFTRIIPLIAIFAFLGSLLEAFLILPSHVADFVRRPSGTKITNFMRKAKLVYRYILKNMLRYRYLTGPGFLLLAAGTIYFGFTYMNIIFFQEDYLDYYRIDVQTAHSNSLEETEEITRKIEQTLQNELPSDAYNSILTIVGRSARQRGLFSTRENLAVLTVDVTEKFSLKHKPQEIFRKNREILRDLEGIKKLQVLSQQIGPPQSKDIDVEVSGPDLDVARGIALKGKRILAKQRGVSDLQTDYDRGPRRIEINPDRERASFHGISTKQIANTVRGYFDGTTADTLRWEEEEMDLLLHTDADKPYNASKFRQLTINSSTGLHIPLDYLIDIRWNRGAAARIRINGTPTVSLLGDVNENVTSVTEALNPLRSALQRELRNHPEYQINYGGGNEDLALMGRSLKRAGIVALVLIFLLMGALFKNVLQPLVVMSTVPFCLFGIIIGMLFWNEPLGFMSLMGTVAVAGVVVNDSMLLVHFTNIRRMEGRSLLYAIMKAGTLRFRPVVLTTVTTIAGLAPIAFWTSGQEAILSPMALAIIWGIASGTFLTLLVIPCLYFISEEIYRALGRNSLHHQKMTKDFLENEVDSRS